MFPAYGFKHAYPQGRAPMSADCGHHPTSEGLHPQMKMEASPSPFLHEAWPHHYTYPVPTQFHSCCNHSAYPNYYPYRPPYPHFPSPPLHPQCYGGYPVLPEPYPFQYAPPPHYTMQLPNYEYDKSFPRESHCCGCHHHTPDIKGDKGVKIEEQESEAEDSLVPTGFSNIRHPPEYNKNQSVKRISEGVDGRRSRVAADHQEGPSVIMPLDAESLKKLLQNGNLKRDHDDQPKNQSQQIQMPFPVIWLPHNNEESSSRQQSLKSEQGDDHTKKSIPPVGAEGGKEGKILSQKSDSPLKTIHGKQMEEPADDMKTSSRQLEKTIEERKNSTENGTKKKTTSPTKASKLPPVCLRVDPLPKRKNNAVKSSSPTGVKKEINIVDMEDRSRSVELEIPSKKAGDESQCGEKEDVGQKAEEIKEPVEKKPEKRVLSGTEAAIIIQSAYRGYEVRRLEPLKKMRQIANIRDEASAVKTCIEACASSSMDLKQKMALGETIMNLLLKLDTVQGLHSSIRDFRKSVAKELVSLQEMLDTIEVKQPDHSPEDTRAVAATIQTPDESSLRLGTSEAEVISEAGETEVETADGSSQNSGFGETEDGQGVEKEENAEDQISAVPDLLADGMIPEQTLPEKEESDELDAKEEVKVAEIRVDSADQTEMKHDNDLLAELPLGIPDEDVTETITCSNAEKSQQMNIESELEQTVDEGSEPPVTEPEQPESDEASKAEVSIQQDAETVIPEVKDECQEVLDQALVAEENACEEDKHDNETTKEIVHDLDAKPAEDADEGEQKEIVHDLDAKPAEEANDQVPVAEENTREEEKHDDETTKEIVRDLDAKPAMEENERMRNLLEKLIEAEKQQQEVISSLNEKLKELEGKLAKQKQQKKKKSARTRKAKVLMPRSCKTTSNSFSKEAPMGLAL